LRLLGEDCGGRFVFQGGLNFSHLSVAELVVMKAGRVLPNTPQNRCGREILVGESGKGE
jgi:hypothetical protein